MPRKPLATITDHFGDGWNVFEIRDTAHLFPVYLGRPARGSVERRGGNRVILTSELAEHLEAHRRDTFESMALPIGSGAIKRLRRLLGHHRYEDAADFWEARFHDLATLTLEQFAAKHGVKAGAVERARLMLVGKLLRDAGWWREESIRSLLTSDAPASEIADALGIPAGSVGRLRSILKTEGYAIATDYRERIARAKRGKPAHPNTRRALVRAARRKKTLAHRTAISESLRRWSVAAPKRPVNPEHRLWTPREERLLGTTLDSVVARILGHSKSAVRDRRRFLGIPLSRHSRLHQSPRPRGPKDAPAH